MSRLRRLLAACAAAVLLAGSGLLIGVGGAGAAPAAVAAAVPAATGAGAVALHGGHGISVVSSTVVAPRLLDVTVSTPALAGDAGVRVLVPAGYDPAGSTRYPVLYLLHGGQGSYTDWTTSGDAEQLTAGMPLIVVMPEGGAGGWYSNWQNFGFGGPPEWETFHIDELVPWVDANFRTVADRSGRAIAGLSMGGFGAMSYAARHPDLFASASSFSGAVDPANPAVEWLIAFSPLVEQGLPGAIYGIPPFDEPALQAHNPTALAARLAGMHLALYTGNGRCGPLDTDCSLSAAWAEIQESFVQQMSQAMDARLTSLGIAHTFCDYGNGTHSWPYWVRDLRWELPAIVATFVQDGSLPASALATAPTTAPAGC